MFASAHEKKHQLEICKLRLHLTIICHILVRIGNFYKFKNFCTSCNRTTI